MKISLLAASLLVLCSSASAQVSISVGQPGFYGRIDIGDMGPPPVLYREPIIVQRPVHVIEQPLYLRVPPGHAKNWRKHCGRYNACGRRVLFVKDDWYLNDYAPRYRNAHHHDRRDRHDSHHDRRDDRHDRHDDRGHEKGNGRGHDKGHDKGHGNGHGRGHGRD